MSNYNILSWNVNSIRALVKKLDLNEVLKNVNVFYFFSMFIYDNVHL